MKLIVGLGNPGEMYTRTRHNIGRRLAEFIASQERVSFSEKSSHKIALSSFQWTEPVKLAYPLTYMNLSGEAVGEAVRYWKVDPARELLIIVDDAALPFGRFRLRGEGSSGGHNGLKSIEAHLGTNQYARLRIGIGTEDESGAANIPLEDYVLGRFSPEEESQMEKIFERGAAAVRLWSEEPLEKAMNRINAADF